MADRDWLLCPSSPSKNITKIQNHLMSKRMKKGCTGGLVVVVHMIGVAVVQVGMFRLDIFRGTGVLWGRRVWKPEGVRAVGGWYIIGGLVLLYLMVVLLAKW